MVGLLLRLIGGGAWEGRQSYTLVADWGSAGACEKEEEVLSWAEGKRSRKLRCYCSLARSAILDQCPDDLEEST